MVKELLYQRALYLPREAARATARAVIKLDSGCGLILSGCYLAVLVSYAGVVQVLCHLLAYTVERRFMPLSVFLVTGVLVFGGLL